MSPPPSSGPETPLLEMTREAVQEIEALIPPDADVSFPELRFTIRRWMLQAFQHGEGEAEMLLSTVTLLRREVERQRTRSRQLVEKYETIRRELEAHLPFADVPTKVEKVTALDELPSVDVKK